MTEFEKSGKPRFQIDTSEERPQDRAIVIVPVLGQNAVAHTPNASIALARRSDASRLEEAIGLASAIELDIVHSGLIPLNKVKPATLIGGGKVDELKGIIAALNAGLVVVDHPLTPVQQRNLEKEWDAKVIDRTGLILEIFGARAQTKEGRLQVELAHLNYQKGRLVRSWTHLERQRGGVSTVGGPGETQIESDRRQLQARVNSLERDLEKVRRTRNLHRAQRKKVPHPIVALVGYTNAGKSTLFNHITGSAVLAKDMLFATLDPTLRRLELPEGTLVILSDTVGFVSDLPTHLVAAFRATLEEVIEADLILHVRDIADPDTQAQAEDVYNILAQLGIGEDGHRNVLEVWNKIDLLDSEALEAIRSTRNDDGLLLSAITGEGTPELLKVVEDHIAASDTLLEFDLSLDAMGQLNWIYQNTNVLERQDKDDGTLHLKVRVPGSAREALLGRVV